MSRDGSGLNGRREALVLFGTGAYIARRAVAAPEETLHPAQIDHIEFWVSNAEKSAAFYARIFGYSLLKNNKTERRYLKIGSAFLAMDQGQQSLRVDHFCAGISGFQVANMHSYLEQRGIAYKDYPSGKDLYVTDPDGIRLQLGKDNSWTDLQAGTASPLTAPHPDAEPIFRPSGVDHILLNISEPEKSVAFYEKILGPVTQRNNNRTWFQAGKTRVGLLKTPDGQNPGVNHFCVSAAAFDYDAAMKKLELAGAKPVAPEVAGAPEFRDPDGYLVQVMGPRG